jgi:hypothetical protein
VERIELPLMVLETIALPLYYTGIFGWQTWARTRDTRINSPLLYQLSYMPKKLLKDLKLACPERFELPTPKVEALCSIQLSYGQRNFGAVYGARTHGLQRDRLAL